MKIFHYILFFISFISFGQEDTLKIQEIIPVKINYVGIGVNLSTKQQFYLNKKEIEDLQLNDAGELIQKFSGTTVKSYGGLGGLKTVSMRGLGANHTSIIVDGFPINNAQTGQVNLSQIQVDNIEFVNNSMISELIFLAPVSAQTAGSTISIYTFQDTKPTDTFSLRGNAKYGSFGQKDFNLSTKYKIKKMYVSVFGKYRNADGDYPYSYLNGVTEVNGIRQNNDYLDYYYGGTIGYDVSNTLKVRLGYKTSTIDQGLPGAVILYNETADERLHTSDQTIYSEIIKSFKKLDLRFYGNYDLNKMNYLDPTFLNNSGGINVDYKNQSTMFGGALKYDLSDRVVLFGGLEQQISDLVASDSLFANPLRYHNFGLLGVNLHFDFATITSQISSQYVSERNRAGNSANDKFELNPYFKMESRELGKMRIVNGFWYRNSFRMPTFNELYYNNIGNTSLNPEKANQFNYTLSLKNRSHKKVNIFIMSNLFFNRVHDRIVAIPTKNLFVWSMQNVGITNTYGADVSVKFTRNYKELRVGLDANYTFNKTLDVTDESDPTYGHQIAYIPVHTGNINFSLSYKKVGFRISNYATSLRYALNENVSQNTVDGFLITDISAYYKVKIHSKNTIAVRLSVKNIFNQSYSYVRSYIMPGINYVISASYAFN